MHEKKVFLIRVQSKLIEKNQLISLSANEGAVQWIYVLGSGVIYPLEAGALIPVLATIFLLIINCIRHIKHISYHWHQAISRWHHGKTEEHEGADQWCSIWPAFLETNNDMVALENIFSVLQKSNKALFRSFGKYSCWDLHKQFVIPKESFPTDLQAVRQGYFEAQVRGFLCRRQNIQIALGSLDVDRGLF